jgi:D-galactarolactone cycloisomerase
MPTAHRRSFLGTLVAGGLALAGKAAAGSLADHRIAKIEAKTSHDRYVRYVGRNAKGNPAGRGFGRQLRILTTDGGVRGGGMSHVPDDQVQKLVGARVSDLYDIRQGVVDEALAIDLPLHDLAGNILGKPVYALLGGKGSTAVPIYSGAIYFDDLEPPEKPRGVSGVVASCQQDYDAGYRAFKLKIGRGFKWIPGPDGLQRDIAVTRAVREAFPDCKILVDANDAYTCEQFLIYLDGVKDCDLF